MAKKNKSDKKSPTESPSTTATQGAQLDSSRSSGGSPDAVLAAGPVLGDLSQTDPSIGTATPSPEDAAKGTSAPPLFNAAAMDAQAKKGDELTLEKMDLKQLLELRQRIDALLPPRSIKDMDLEEEAVLQYQLAKLLMNETIAGPAPANQKAQTMNTCSAILATLAKTQTDLYDAEHTKIIVSCLERAFAGAPTAVKEAFYARYEKAISTKIAQKEAKNS